MKLIEQFRIDNIMTSNSHIEFRRLKVVSFSIQMTSSPWLKTDENQIILDYLKILRTSPFGIVQYYLVENVLKSCLH